MKTYIVATVSFPEHYCLYKTIVARNSQEAKMIYSNIFGIINNIQIICDF